MRSGAEARAACMVAIAIISAVLAAIIIAEADGAADESGTATGGRGESSCGGAGGVCRRVIAADC